MRKCDIVYGRKLGVALTLDVFQPDAPTGSGVLWLVSGGWYSNHDGINPAIAELFTRRGQTLFAVAHSSQPKFTLPEIVPDIHRAVRFVRHHAAEFGVDPRRIGITGASAGGHLALMIGVYGGSGSGDETDPGVIRWRHATMPRSADDEAIDRLSSRVAAVAAFFPPTDMLNYGAEGRTFLDHMIRPDEPENYFSRIFANLLPELSREELAPVLREMSPLYGVDSGTPPTLIIHGDADSAVPVEQSQRLIQKLEALQVPCRLEVREGQEHGWPEWESEYSIVAEWFDEHLA